MKKKYIFVHIPKCGGTTIRSTMWPHAKNPLHLFPENKIDEMSDSDLFAHDMIFSHCSLPHFKNRFGKRIEDYKIISSIRNPIERYISEFFQWKRGGHTETWQQYIDIPLNQNAITYFLTGSRLNHDNMGDICFRKIGLNYVFDLENLTTELPAFMEQEGFCDFELHFENRKGFDCILSKTDLFKIKQSNKSDIEIWQSFKKFKTIQSDY